MTHDDRSKGNNERGILTSATPPSRSAVNPTVRVLCDGGLRFGIYISNDLQFHKTVNDKGKS